MPITVPYWELIEGLEEGATEQGPYARKHYLVNWLDRFQFARDMSGLSSAAGPTAPWIRGVPYPYPDSGAGGNMYAKALSIVPEGNVVYPSTPIKFEYARVVVSFGTLTWDAAAGDDPLDLNSISADPAENESLQFATQELSFGQEIYPVPHSSCKFSSDSAKVNVPMTIKLPVITMVLTYHRYPLMPMNKIKDLVGGLNDSTFLGCSTGTVYFDGCDTIREAAVDGTITQKVRLVFKYRPKDWNWFLRPDGIVWELVVDSAGNSLYDYVNLRQVLL